MRLSKVGNFTVSVLLILFAVLFIHSNVNAQTPVASFSSSVSQGCSPLNVLFTNTSTNAVSYLWNFGNGNTSTLQNPSNVYSQAGNYTATLTVTSASGLTSTTSKQISVVVNPVANFTIVNNVACQGYGVIQFTNLSLNYDSCVWDFGDGTTSSVTNPSHIFTSYGTFNIKLIAYNKVFGCSDIKIQTNAVTINPQPTTTITVDSLVTCDTLHQFNFSSSALGQISTYNWNFGDGTSASVNNPAHVYSTPGNYLVNLITTNSFGCIDTSSLIDTIKVKNNPVPVIVMTDTNGCTPLNINFLCYTTNGISYHWDFDNGSFSSTGNSVVIYTNPGVYNPSLTINYANGCSQKRVLGPVNVEQAPQPGFAMVNYTGCVPLTVTFNNTTTPSGNYTYLWDFGDGTTSSQMNPIHVYDSIGYFVASLTVTSPNGCTNVYRNGWYYVSAVGPIARYRADVTAGCNPLTVNFTNQSTGSISWLWNFGDGTTSTAQHPVHVFNANGIYNVLLIAYNSQGCTDTFSLATPINVSQVINSYVPPSPIHGCAPLNANFADASASSAWLWDFGDGTTSNLSNPNHTFTTPGTYVVSLTTWGVNGGCERYIPNFQTFIIDEANLGFTYTVSSCPPYEVFFTDTSSNVSSWSWNFGDGGTSTLQNPSHIFGNTGLYDVTLIGTTPNGCPTTLSLNNGVVITGLGANPSLLLTDTLPPYEVTFYANSQNATSWLWDFGDGTTSTLQNPTHIYTTAGPFTISLSIANDSCSVTNDYPPISFGGSSSSGGPIGGGVYTPPDTIYNCSPYTVNFSSPDPSAIGWEWDFGDGVTSNLENPVHTYVDSGMFVPRIILTFPSGFIDTLYYANPYFVVKAVTDFDIQTTNTCLGVIVDVSVSGSANNFLWNFDNGVTFSTPTATYTYPNTAASYLISLSVSDTNQCNSYVAKSFTITNESPISANKRRVCANDTVWFNSGNINFSSYLWDFGDGNTSSLKNPFHIYADSGLFLVTLSVVDIAGCTLVYQMNYNIEVFDPVASFTMSTPTSNCSWVYTSLTNQSTNSDSWLWTFGDGTSSTQFSPYHYYTQLGYHTITLTAYKNICSTTYSLPNAIYVPNRSADFTYTQTESCLPVTINFQDLSVDAVKWRWDFGDGDTSVLQNPTHIYTSEPTSQITLSITDTNGCTVSISKPNIDVTNADFSPSLTAGCNPSTVTFADSSINPLSWQWDFGDGTTSNLQSPTHTYTVDGLYDIQLIVESSSGCFDTLKVDTLISVLTSTANFIADSTSGCAPLIVNFTDGSLNAVNWQWDFGDGSFSSLQNPSHIYSLPGKYSVTLIVTNANGCVDTLIIDDYINAYGALPDFSISTLSGCSPLTVEFTDLSLGAIDWDWNFGDGNIDSVQNPVHVYADSGSFFVTLYAIDSVGCYSAYTYPQAITTSPSPNAHFIKSDSIGCNPVVVNFDELNTTADSLIWLMGDGTILYGSKPSYTYSTAGTYFITLIAKNIGGCIDSISDPVPVIVLEKPQSNFNPDINEGCMPVVVNFTNSSINTINPTFYWDFGNGDTSSQQNPTYTYTTSGVYSPSLVVSNQGGCSDTITFVDLITVFDQLPPSASRIYRVSVVDNDKVKINWQLNTALDIDHYVIYRLNSSTLVFDSIATISHNSVAISGNAPEYIDAGLNTLQNSYSYKVAAVDRCGYQIPLSALRAHGTMELKAVAGFMNVDLNWSPYLGCEISSYEIYRSDNGGALTLLASVDTSQTTFNDATAVCPYEFTYTIRAVNICEDPNFDSWSDTSSATPQSDISNQILDITRSTVVDDKFILTEWKDPIYRPDLVDRYNIFRSTDSINYSLIASVPNGVHEYSDYNVDVDGARYFYRVEIQNVCNSQTLVGKISSSILLRAIQYETSNSLMWSRYVDWDTGVEKYVIEKLNKFGVWEQIQVVTGNITEWVEE